jgi:triphosphoribosyl-dephospho-CoA synthetase
MSLNRIRNILGAYQGRKRISYASLVRLVQREGLPVHPNPFSPGTWAFIESEVHQWFLAYLARERSTRFTKRGRPRTLPLTE